MTSHSASRVEALVGLHSHCILDGEAVACDDKGMPCFDRLRRRRHDEAVFLYPTLLGQHSARSWKRGCHGRFRRKLP
jgi:hypothetical protein